MSRSFNQMVRSLAQADDERTLMLAGVSHDLRTPLTKLRLGIEILRDKADEETMARMTRGVEEMDAIIGQFLDFARSTDGEALVAGGHGRAGGRSRRRLGRPGHAGGAAGRRAAGRFAAAARHAARAGQPR